jgi:hypothetical protein
MLNGVFGMKHPFDVAQGRLLLPYLRNAKGPVLSRAEGTTISGINFTRQ